MPDSTDSDSVRRRPDVFTDVFAGVFTPETNVVANERALLCGIRDGGIAAFTALFDQYFVALHQFAMVYTKTSEEAEDAVQDVFFRVWDSRATLSVQTSVAQYLFGAVRNRAMQLVQREQALHRREAGAVTGTSGNVQQAGTSVLEEDELRRRLAQAIDNLPPRCREVFVLSRVRRLSQKEIGKVLGIAIPTIKVQLGRALKALDLARRRYEEGR